MPVVLEDVVDGDDVAVAAEPRRQPGLPAQALPGAGLPLTRASATPRSSVRSCASHDVLGRAAPELALQQVAAGDHAGRGGDGRGGLRRGHGARRAGTAVRRQRAAAVRARGALWAQVSGVYGALVSHSTGGEASHPTWEEFTPRADGLGPDHRGGLRHGRPLPPLPALRRHRASQRDFAAEATLNASDRPRWSQETGSPSSTASASSAPRSRAAGQRPPGDRPARHRPRRLAGRLRDGRPRVHARRRFAPRDRRPPDRGRHPRCHPAPPRLRPAARARGRPPSAGSWSRSRFSASTRRCVGTRRLVALAPLVGQADRDPAPVLGAHRAHDQPVLLQPADGARERTLAEMEQRRSSCIRAAPRIRTRAARAPRTRSCPRPCSSSASSSAQVVRAWRARSPAIGSVRSVGTR